MTLTSNSRILQFLIDQCTNPSGFIGNLMIPIWNRTFPKMALWGFSHINFQARDNLLEIGFGGGKIIRHLAEHERCENIYGIDVSALAVKKAAKLNQHYIKQRTVTLSQNAAEDFSFPEKLKFDKILAIQTHIYWQQLEQSLKNIAASLRNNGELDIICEKDKIYYHLPQYVEQQDMLSILKKTGFPSVQIFETKTWIHYQCYRLEQMQNN